MDIGETIIISLAVVGFFIFLIVTVVTSRPSSETYSSVPKTPMWETTKTTVPFGDSCIHAVVDDPTVVKICILPQDHEGTHMYARRSTNARSAQHR